MEKLSIEEKAKAYDKAIEKAKEKYAMFEGMQAGDVLEDVFPELKESEDEKIRKRIISALVEWNEKCSFPGDSDDMIVWLEKQGNSPIKWNKNTEGNKPQANHSVLMKTTHGIAEGEWKGEGWLQYRWAGIVRDSDVLSWMELSDLEKQGEQESAWSKEDEEMIKETLYFIREYQQSNRCKDEAGMQNSASCEKWLKSLKQRIGG